MTPELEKRFQQAHHSRFARLLKLVVLRDVVLELHRTKSKLMTRPDSRAKAQKLERDLRALEHAPEGLLQEESIEKVLAGSRSPRATTAGLGPRFQRLFSDSRFTRPDRKWERAMTEEALLRQWTLGVHTRELPFSEVQSFHEGFSRGLWPDGAVLFVEGAGHPPPNVWRGRWWVVTRKPDPGLKDFVPLFVLGSNR